MDKKEIGRLFKMFTPEQNKEIKRELVLNIRRDIIGVEAMSELALDKAVKSIRYNLQLYELSDKMHRKLQEARK